MKNSLRLGVFATAFLALANVSAATWELNRFPADEIQQDWGKPGINKSVEGKQFKVGGTTYAKGIGTHANSSMRIALYGKASKIKGFVGVDDEVGTRGSVRFSIVDAGTNKTLWESGVRKGGQAALAFDVELAGVQTIILKADDAGDKNMYDHADWLDVTVQYEGEAPSPVPNPMLLKSANVQWLIAGEIGKPLMQSALATKAGSAVYQAVYNYPMRDPGVHESNAYVMPFTLHVKQSNGARTIEPLLKSQSAVEIIPGIKRNTYLLEDPAYPTTVELTVTAYVETDIFTSQVKITNNGTEPVELLNRDAALVSLPKGPAYIANFSGDWGRELTRYREFEIPEGTLDNFHTGMTRSAAPKSPHVVVSFGGPAKEESGDVFMASIAWGGAWHYSLTRTMNDDISFAAGAVAMPVELAPGKSYTSPEIIMTFSNEGKGKASRNFHRWARKHGIMNGEKQRPIVLNSWEGVYFNFTEQKVIDMIDSAAALGVEMFVLDDGWFGNKNPRNGDSAGLGDWQVNKKKLPNGIDKLIDACEKNGIDFGIWVEPEMVNPNSDLFNAHPEWVMQIPKRELITQRKQYMLDLSQPAVEAFVYKSVADILKAHPRIKYVKWDANAASRNAGSASLGDDQGALSDRYQEAYLRVMAKLRKDFPNVMFQLCASGGYRVEYGAMKYHDEFWASDNSTALQRILIQWGYSHFYPNNAIASHISRYTDVDYKLRADVAMTCRLGIELSPAAISAENREIVKRGVAAYKTIRPLLHSADLYRGRSPHESQTSELTFVAQDKKEAVFFAFKRDKNAKTEMVKMSGLDPEKTYKITEINPDTTARFESVTKTGKELMSAGLEIRFPANASSAVAKLVAE